MLLGCCHCGEQPSSLPPSSLPPSSLPSGGSYIASVTPACTPCSVMPKRYTLTSTASMFTFSSVGSTRTDCGGWDQTFTLKYNGISGSTAASLALGTAWANRCAVWKTDELALHTNTSPSGSRCTGATGLPRWELIVVTVGGVATAHLFAWHTGGLVFGVPAEMFVRWSETITPVSGSNCVMDLDIQTGPTNWTGTPTPTYTSNNTIAPSVLIQPA